MTDKSQFESSNNAPSGASQKSNASPTQDNPCSLCRAFGTPPPCKGHGGSGGGGGDDGGSSNNESNNKSEHNNEKTNNPFINIENASSAVSSKNEVNYLTLDWKEELTSRINIIHLDKGLLNIECDNLRGTLIIQTKSGLSEENIVLAKQAQQMIKTEFDLFKEELQEKGIAVSHFTATIKDESLTINIPHPKYFSEFIQRLADINLLPHPKVHEEKQTFSQAHDKYPSPFDIAKGPKPPGWKKER